MRQLARAECLSEEACGDARWSPGNVNGVAMLVGDTLGRKIVLKLIKRILPGEWFLKVSDFPPCLLVLNYPVKIMRHCLEFPDSQTNNFPYFPWFFIDSLQLC